MLRDDRVERYELFRTRALSFRLYRSLDGGARQTLSPDPFGDALILVLLSLEIDRP
jgi:hypothetical protein